MSKPYDRRQFLRSAAGFGVAIGIADRLSAAPHVFGHTSTLPVEAGRRVGIIGLDTSHATAFTQALNGPKAGAEYAGYRVVAAYPQGSLDIVSSVERIPAYTEQVRKLGVEIVGSVADLLQRVDVVLLETNDGRRHLEQALQVFEAGKPVFIDKPVAASLKDAVAIFAAAEKRKVPVFSSSSLRYTPNVQEAAAGKAGKILGVDAWSPMKVEQTHPDLFWYGIHGVETLFTLMGTGCRQVSRVRTGEAEVVTGVWADGRIGSFRGLVKGKQDYGATVFGEKGILTVGPHVGYDPLLRRIISFFQTGQPPVPAAETLEIFAFMEAADESKRKGGKAVELAKLLRKAGAAFGV
jgi:predicted dehydrogenase